jgi:hypothetical protein
MKSEKEIQAMIEELNTELARMETPANSAMHTSARIQKWALEWVLD